MTDILDPHVSILRPVSRNDRPRVVYPQHEIDKCESPIERTFYAEFRAWLPEIAIEPQVAIGGYRVDFLVDALLIVECDGDAYHYATDDQRRRDIARHAALVKHGYPIIRFTGKQITRDPYDCVKRAYLYLTNG